MRPLAFVMLSLLAAGCGAQEPEQGANPAGRDVILAAAAATVVDSFQNDLKGELMAAMKQGGAAAAIEVCHTRAPEIAADHSRAGAWSIVRLTDRPRRPENAANPHQREVLAMFNDTAGVRDAFTEWRISEAGDTSFVYYQPIRIGGLCINCHGSAEKLAPGVAERLAQLYPEDQATGYAVGDLRGMFVVTMAWPQAQAPAEDLIQESADSTGETQ